MRKGKNLIFLVLAFLVLTSSIFAQKIPQSPPQGRNLPLREVMEELNLTPQQREKLEALRNKLEKENIRIKAELKIKRIELQEMIDNPASKEKEIFNKIEEIGDLQKKLLKNKFSAVFELRKILTKEQAEKLRDLQRGKGKMIMKPGGKMNPGDKMQPPQGKMPGMGLPPKEGPNPEEMEQPEEESFLF